MADFCRQCYREYFGRDDSDMANLTNAQDWASGRAVIELCEGCGAIQVDPQGNCVSPDCMMKHPCPHCQRGDCPFHKEGT